MKLTTATSEEEIQQARELFEEYSASLGLDLCFQDFAKELADLPGDYAPPNGRLWLVAENDEIAGCIALRKIGPGIGEMKRLYVRPKVSEAETWTRSDRNASGGGPSDWLSTRKTRHLTRQDGSSDCDVSFIGIQKHRTLLQQSGKGRGFYGDGTLGTEISGG